jgi:uncharacterized membrane protein
MSTHSEVSRLLKVAVIAVFATLAFLGTTVIRVPIPGSGGYFNLGDTFVMTAGLLYGPLVGALVGLIGPALADALGFPSFILATAIIKFCEGGAVGLISRTASSQDSIRPLLALGVGILILVGGYYIFEASIYPFLAQSIPYFDVSDPKAALTEIIPNLLQGIISAVIAYGIFRIFRRNEF